MKKQSANLFTPISTEEKAALTSEVKETLAFGLANSHNKTFNAIDLWNIHRQRKHLSSRRLFV